jgi:hypothetical protein
MGEDDEYRWLCHKSRDRTGYAHRCLEKECGNFSVEHDCCSDKVAAMALDKIAVCLSNMLGVIKK